MAEVIYKRERERAKIGISPKTLAYIEVLEQIAEAGYDLWIKLGQANEKQCADDLYDALAQVDFMHDESHDACDH